MTREEILNLHVGDSVIRRLRHQPYKERVTITAVSRERGDARWRSSLNGAIGYITSENAGMFSLPNVNG